MLYLLTSAHIDSTGCYHLPEGYALCDTGFARDTWQKALDELTKSELILHDPESDWVLILRWFKHNPPMNKSHLDGTKKRIAEIGCDALREQCEADFCQAETELLQRLEKKELAKIQREVNQKKNTMGYGHHLTDRFSK